MESAARHHYTQHSNGAFSDASPPTFGNVKVFNASGVQIPFVSSIDNPYTYTGREYDVESGMYYYRARYYNPGTGKFLQEDPIGFGGQDVNFYRYVANNPVNFTDPSGRVLCNPGLSEGGFIANQVAIVALQALIGKIAIQKAFAEAAGDHGSALTFQTQIEEFSNLIDELSAEPVDIDPFPCDPSEILELQPTPQPPTS